ncbi:MAG: GFA family protein [Alphaproteobacteria bacterium]|nr:GFA family protein [Alphaproteobacteria bacterium]
MEVGTRWRQEGGCSCGEIRYAITAAPMFVHCCHCKWCQRETGTAFALNAMIESDHVETLSGKPEAIKTPSESGKGQIIHRCPKCQVAVWSHYAGAGDAVAFVRVGTLDNSQCSPPDVHIYTDSKQPWVIIPEGASQYPGYYKPREEWPEDSQKRFMALKNREK